MTYAELMKLVLAEKSINARAKELGIPQKTLEGYVKERSYPGCAMTMKFAEAAGVPVSDAVEAVAQRESQVRPKRQFTLPHFSATAATLLVVIVNLFLTPTPSEAAPALKSNGEQFILCQIRRRISAALAAVWFPTFKSENRQLV